MLMVRVRRLLQMPKTGKCPIVHEAEQLMSVQRGTTLQ